MSGYVVDILLVEDDSASVRLTIEALKEAKVDNRLTVAKDGVDALDLLFRRGAHVKARRPDIVLLDLNLPNKSGLEVLEEIKRDDDLRRIPVVVLTTSGADDDVLRSYDLHVNSFITKPLDMEQFIGVMRALDSFWFRVATLPNRPGSL